MFLVLLDLRMGQQVFLAILNPGPALFLGRSTSFCFFKDYFSIDLFHFFPGYYYLKNLDGNMSTRISCKYFPH